jgi:hypothetical protein
VKLNLTHIKGKVMKKIITIALLVISTTLAAQSVRTTQLQPKSAKFIVRMHYGLKEKAGLSTEVLLPTQKRVLFGFNFMFDIKDRTEMFDLYSSEFMLGFEILPNIIIGGKAGWSTHDQIQSVLTSQVSKSKTPSYEMSRALPTNDNIYDTRSVSILPSVGGFITTTTSISPFIAFDSFSGVTFGLGIKLP